MRYRRKKGRMADKLGGTMAISARLDNIQRLIINSHREMFGESPSPMKLQKLCYYAQGFMLAQNVSLFDEDFQAWQHGPVVPGLYHKYKDYQWHVIGEDVAAANVATEVATEVAQIVAAYGRYDGAALSTMTHREAPWLDARGDIPESANSTETITKQSMRDFFFGKLNSDGKN